MFVLQYASAGLSDKFKVAGFFVEVGGFIVHLLLNGQRTMA